MPSRRALLSEGSAALDSPLTLHTPALFLTVKDAVSQRVDGFEAGGDDYLVKPFAMEELIVRVRRPVDSTSLHPAVRLRWSSDRDRR